MSHRFYSEDRLLFALEAAAEYDTATPYRYAVSRFVNVATLIRQGQPVTVITRHEQQQTVAEHTAVLQTVAQLWSWLSEHFSGFETYVP